MAITTYTELKDAIADFIARSDLSAVIPNFITLAESRMSRSIRSLELQATVTSTLTDGAITIPTDYQEHISCKWIGTRTQDLAYVEPDSPEWRFRYRPNGDPQMFTIMAGHVEVRPAAAGDVKFYYFKTLTSDALSVSNVDNWLLTKCPDMYLYGSIAEYHLYMKDDQRAAQFLVLAKAEGEKENIATDTAKFMNNPQRPVDTGNQGSRAFSNVAVGG